MFDSAAYAIAQLFVWAKETSWWCIPTALPDAQNPQEEMFGEERLLQIIRQEAPSGSQAVEQKFLKAIEEFTEGTPQTDDITFVVVEKYQ